MQATKNGNVNMKNAHEALFEETKNRVANNKIVNDSTARIHNADIGYGKSKKEVRNLQTRGSNSSHYTKNKKGSLADKVAQKVKTDNKKSNASNYHTRKSNRQHREQVGAYVQHQDKELRNKNVSARDRAIIATQTLVNQKSTLDPNGRNNNLTKESQLISSVDRKAINKAKREKELADREAARLAKIAAGKKNTPTPATNTAKQQSANKRNGIGTLGSTGLGMGAGGSIGVASTIGMEKRLRRKNPNMTDDEIKRKVNRARLIRGGTGAIIGGLGGYGLSRLNK